MNILFLNAVLLPLLALILLPPLLHMFARARPPAYRFPSVEFIRRVVRKTQRVRRPREWLLLLLRTLLFAAITLLFLRPLYLAEKMSGGIFDRRHVVLVIDATASMGCTEGARTRFASACAEASEIMSGLSSRDTANIIWMKAEPQGVFAEPGVNLGYLQGELRRARVTSERGNPADAVGLATRMLEGLEGRREICVISDFQASQWADARLATPHGINLVMVRVGDRKIANAAIAELACEPAAPLAGDETLIRCEVRNFGDAPVRRKLFLSVDESHLSRTVSVGAGGSAVAVFPYHFGKAGNYRIEAQLEEDEFAGDDSRALAVNVAKSVTAGVYSGTDAAGAEVWTRALRALGWVDVEMLSKKDIESTDLSEYDALFISGWRGEGVGKITAALDAGTLVVISAGDGCPVSAFRRLSDSASDSTEDGILHWRKLEKPQGLVVTQRDDSLFRIFVDGECGDITRGIFRGRIALGKDVFPESRLLLAYSDGTPALARLPGRTLGTAYFWNMPLSRDETTWSWQVEFVPFMGELLLSGRNSAGGAYTIEAGEHLVYSVSGADMPETLRLVDMQGNLLKMRIDREGNRAVSEGLPEPGVYLWKNGEQLLAYGVVNFPAVESDLRQMPVESIKGLGAAAAVTSGRKVRELRDGLPLWRYLLTAAFLLALFEGALLLIFERKS
jgi:hypothetical protein